MFTERVDELSPLENTVAFSSIQDITKHNYEIEPRLYIN